MREALKRLGGESVVYGLGQVSGRAVQLLLVPILTRALAPEAYGVSELILAYLQTTLLVLVFGMDGALARFFYHEPDAAARVRMASSSFAFRLATGLIVAAALAASAAPLSRGLVGSEAYRKYVLIGAVTVPFSLVVMFANDVLRVTFQPWKFIALNVTQMAVIGGLSLYLVLGRGLDVVGVLYGKLGGDVLCALLGLVLVRRYVKPRLDAAVLRRMLRYGVPLVPVAFAYGAITSVDRWMLQATRGLEEVAVYSVAVKFFAVVTMGVSAFQLAYGPFAFARAADPEAPRLYARVLSIYVAGAAFGALAIGAFAPEALALLVPPAYAAAAAPAAWLVFAAVAQGAYYALSVGIGLALRTPLLGWSAGGAALVAIAGNVVLTPRLGPAGAAMATTAGYVASAVLTYVIAQRVHPVPYRALRAAFVFALALALGLALQRWAPAGPAGVGLKLGALLAYALVAWRLEPWTDRGGVSHRPAPA